MKSSVILHGFSDSQQMQTKKAFETSSSLEYWFGSKSPEITKRGKIFTSHFCSFVSHFIFVQPDYISLREKNKSSVFLLFLIINPLYCFIHSFWFFKCLLGNLSVFCKFKFILGFYTSNSYIFQSSFWPFPCVSPSFVHDFLTTWLHQRALMRCFICPLSKCS